MCALMADREFQQFITTTAFRFQHSFRSFANVGSCGFHRHPCFEIVLHTDCSGSTTLETGQSLTFEAGSIVINPPFLQHDQRTRHRGIDTCILIETSCPIPAILNQIIPIPDIQAPWVFSDINLLINAPTVRNGLDSLALNHRAASLFLQLLQHADTPLEEVSSSAHTTLALQADAIIRREYATLRNVSELANRLAVSGDHLRHSYQRHFGTGMKQRLTQLRIEHACALLKTSTLPIKAIATQCGFTDDRSFTICFKAVMACTASDYRQKWLRESATNQPM